MFFLVMVWAAVIRMPDPCQGASLALLDVQALNADKKAWVILDARPVKYWERGHIRGAFPFSWEQHTATDKDEITYRVKDPETIGQALGSLGITPGATVVVYADAGESWGGEGWACWVLQWLGHEGKICLLKGGIQAWKRNGFELVKGRRSKPSPTPALYTPKPNPAMCISAQTIKQGQHGFQLVDTRSTREWFMGHLPGAVHIPWTDFFQGPDRVPLEPSQVLTLLKEHRLDPDRQIVYYCTGGIRSGYAWLVHELAGLPHALNFEGGTAEWKVVYP